MTRTTTVDTVRDVTTMLAHLLYASPLPLEETALPSPAEVQLHVRAALHKRGWNACQDQLYTESGHWPEGSAARMRLARAAVTAAYPNRFRTRRLITRRQMLLGQMETEPETSYIPPQQRPAAWAEMARQLDGTGMAAADIAAALAVSEETVALLLAMGQEAAR